MSVIPHSDWVDWLRLEQTPGVGPETARQLLAAFGLPSRIFAAEFTAISQVVSAKIARALLQPVSGQLQQQIELTQAWSGQAGNQLLTLADAHYPRALLDIPDPPVLLYVKGRLALLDAPTVAVVGSRNATAQGIRNAEQFSEALSKAGLTISSGMAAGIDAAAHYGALRGAGSTVAVIGTGADIVYPARNRTLAHLIADGGCIVSEYPLGMPAIASNFPRRNRLISGLAKGVLVIEAAAQSGSLITARMAAEQGRDVFAIPGSIHSPLAKGCHQLIKQGAKLVDTAQDILDELRFLPPMSPAAIQPPDMASSEAASPAITGADQSLLDAIGYDPVHVDHLVERLGIEVAGLSALLLTLELDGHIEQLPGAMVKRLG
ncbi:DNA-processing protein DprA [Undibacterium sp. Jales W-56]|uniref:DNA-processing protein DprA n=1 Tax=Undibacterium sp. Jales W-56 TaxID=2897325 RepID=UPI0021CF5730|nr:DNA-processing protein DprA [Undibacterium sp. Jales W-56]MCU6434433.1 DNA-processing protein DprA [Undibacterium sp. Jales W-56]